MKRGFSAAALLLLGTLMIAGQEVRRALPAQFIAGDDVARVVNDLSGAVASASRIAPRSAAGFSGLFQSRGGAGASFPAL